MFTGIVEELGHVVAVEHGVESAVLQVRGPVVGGDVLRGASIAVNGVCLTVIDFGDGMVSFDVMAETLDRSSLGALRVGDPVNLERAVAVTDRLGGHIVQGHVDGTAHLVHRTPGERWEVVRLTLPPEELARYVVEKGSISVDGVSLTVSALGGVTAAQLSFPDPSVTGDNAPLMIDASGVGKVGPGGSSALRVYYW